MLLGGNVLGDYLPQLLWGLKNALRLLAKQGVKSLGRAMFAIVQTSFGWRCLMRQTASPRCGHPALPMNISSSRADFTSAPKSPVLLPILGCVLIAFAIAVSASVVTNLVFDLIGYR